MPQYSGIWTLSQASQAIKDNNWTGTPPQNVEYLIVAGGASIAKNLFVGGLTASSAVFTDANKGLTTSGTLGITQGGTGAITVGSGFGNRAQHSHSGRMPL